MADVSSEDLVPPLPASEALPPVFPAQNFLGQRSRHHPSTKQDASLPQEVSFVSLSGQDFKNGQLLQPGEQNVGNVEQIEENQRQGAKQIKEPGQASLVPQGESGQNEEEEVSVGFHFRMYPTFVNYSRIFIMLHCRCYYFAWTTIPCNFISDLTKIYVRVSL